MIEINMGGNTGGWPALNSRLGSPSTTSSQNGEKLIKDLKNKPGIIRTPAVRQRRSGAGFTLVEVIVAIAVFSIMLLAVIGLSQQVHQIAVLSSLKTTAATIAQEQMETIRNLPYDQIGSDVTYPTGPLLSTQTVSRNGGTFTVDIAINYVQDPADGLAPTDTVPADYKQVEVRVCWSASSCQKPVRLTTSFVPKTLEFANNAGALMITVSDNNGQPVSGATVQVTNANPAVNVVNQTDIHGQLQLLSLPAADKTYHVVVSKTGYSTDQTNTASAQNPNPKNGDTSVYVSQATPVTLFIDRVGSLLVRALDRDTCDGLGSVTVRITGEQLIGEAPDVSAYDRTFATDAAGQFLISNLPADNYALTIDPGGDDVAGVTPPDTIRINPASSVTAAVVLTPHQDHTARIIVREVGPHAPVANATVAINDGGVYNATLITDQGVLQQNTWIGGPGQTTYGDLTKYATLSGAIDTSSNNLLTLGSTATPGSVTEDFHTVDKKDAGNTTADWNTSAGKISLPLDNFDPSKFTLGAGAQSTTLNTATGKITEATLSATDQLNGQSIIYALAADGLNFENVTPGAAHTFAATGSDLRWRVTLATADQDLTPAVSNLSIQYTQLLRPVVDGTLTSSSFDSGNPTNYTTLSWEPTSQPPSAGANAVRFQVATSGADTANGSPTVDATSNPSTTPLFTKNIGDSANTVFLVQSFVAGANDTIDSLDLKLAQHSAPTTTITAFIYSDAANAPGNNISGSGQDITAAVPSDGSGTWQNSWLTQTFAPHTALVSGTKYWLVLQVSGSNSSKYWTTVRSPDDAGYTNGTAKIGAALTGTCALNGLCPLNYDIAFQVRRSGVVETPTTPTDFIGPDGTTATYYTASGSSIHASLSGRRYLRYRLFLHTDDPLVAPTINRISVIKNNACTPPGQVFFSPLPAGGAYSVDVTATGYQPANAPITVNGNTTQIIELTPNP